ncbi:MAG: hypothetical protein IPO90_04555 [Flavobacteriales bacterium]|nr:hypothetical protein [Flavobacteriales bacterium]
MRNLVLSSTLGIAMLASTSAEAFNLKVHGVVTDYLTGELVTNGLVRVYKDGVKEHAEQTGLLGQYAYTLGNNALYVLRFSAPGCQTKCFTIDTHGLAWEGENKVKDLFVEMTLFQRISDMDLSFFDLPMGQARFEPATGFISWDTDYDLRIRNEVQSIMSEYQRRMTAVADATSSIRSEGSVSRKHSGSAR